MAIREKAKKLDSILKSLEKHYSRSVLSEGEDLLERFVFYWLFYGNPVTNARKVTKAFTDEELFGDWNEVRVATQRELENILVEHRIEDASTLAPLLKNFFQNIFEELDDTKLDPLKELKPDRAKKFLGALEGIPHWAVTYLLTLTDIDSQVPWDPHTERVASRVGLFDSSAPLPQRKKLLRAALQDEDPLRLHHLFVEHGKKTCVEEDPRCLKCPINKDCDYFAKLSRKGGKARKEVAGAEPDEAGTNGHEAPDLATAARSKPPSNGTRPKAKKR